MRRPTNVTAGREVTGRLRRVWRRLIVAAVVVGSTLAVVAGQLGTSRVFAWQMFPESSTRWAVVERVTADGDRVAVTEPWPGGYEWRQLTAGSGLEDVAIPGTAPYGVAVTAERLQRTLDWIAVNTPADDETVRLEAVLWTSHNGRPEEMTTLVSVEREP